MEKSDQKKKILLIAYQFCPKGQIGTRRWSKFAKYLANRGYIVHVISAKYPYKDKINWCHDIENNPNIIIHRIKANYPTFLLQPRRTFFIKLLDRILSYSLYYIDAAQRWGKPMKQHAIKLIKFENIRTVIVTGGPFTPFYHSIMLKKEVPEIQLILDFRDPWTLRLKNNNLEEKLKKSIASTKERQSIMHADKVIFTTTMMKNEYIKLYPNQSHKYHVLYNGYDKDDFKNIQIPSKKKFHLVYVGALMKERAKALIPLLKAISLIDNDLIKKELQIHVFGNDFQKPLFKDPELESLFNKKIIYHGPKHPKELFNLISKYEFGLSINAMEHPNIIVAKTFDYMGLGMKIMLISPKSEIKEMLLQHNQFVADYSVKQIKNCLEKMIQYFEKKNSSSLIHPNYDFFDYDNLTDHIEKILLNN